MKISWGYIWHYAFASVHLCNDVLQPWPIKANVCHYNIKTISETQSPDRAERVQVVGQFANFWYNASHWHHIFQIGLFNFRRHLDQLLLCILTCTSRWLSLKHPLETNSCWQHVTLTSCQPCIPQKKFKDTQNTLYWVVPMCWCIFEAWF